MRKTKNMYILKQSPYRKNSEDNEIQDQTDSHLEKLLLF